MVIHESHPKNLPPAPPPTPLLCLSPSAAYAALSERLSHEMQQLYDTVRPAPADFQRRLRVL